MQYLKNICHEHKVKTDVFNLIEKNKRVKLDDSECVKLFLNNLDQPYMHYKSNATLNRSFTKLQLIDKPIGKEQKRINKQIKEVRKSYEIKEKLKLKLKSEQMA